LQFFAAGLGSKLFICLTTTINFRGVESSIAMGGLLGFALPQLF
jgi:hypothetical protein